MKRTVDEQEESARKVCTDRIEFVMSVRPSEVPEYLRESEFFKSLNTEDDEEFQIGANCMKSDMIVETIEDACNLLHTVRYWGLDISLLPVVKFALTESFATLESYLLHFENEFPVVRALLHVVDERNPRKNRMERAMEVGSIELVNYLQTGQEPISMCALALAAGNGHVNCLQHALQQKLDGDVGDACPVYQSAASQGQLACLKVLDQSKLSISAHKVQYGTSYSGVHTIAWTHHALSSAAANGQLECLQFFHRIGCVITCHDSAAAGGHLPCLHYCLEHQNIPTCWVIPLVRVAATNGHIHCLEYLDTRPVRRLGGIWLTDVHSVFSRSRLHMELRGQSRRGAEWPSGISAVCLRARLRACARRGVHIQKTIHNRSPIAHLQRPLPAVGTGS